MKGGAQTERWVDLKHWARLKRIVRISLLAVVYPILAYLVIVLVGLISVNNGFKPTADGVEILVVSNPVHADFVLPIETSEMNWRELFPASSFAQDTSLATHVAIGWGDKGFYIGTPTWADLRLSTAIHALLLPSETCMHVKMTKGEWHRDHGATVTISQQQYRQLVSKICESLIRSENGSVKQITGAAYGKADAFFQTRGSYHALNTCNSWVGRCLKAAEVKTCLYSPLPRTPSMYFPSE